MATGMVIATTVTTESGNGAAAVVALFPLFVAAFFALDPHLRPRTETTDQSVRR
jgi:hypothetical protein